MFSKNKNESFLAWFSCYLAAFWTYAEKWTCLLKVAGLYTIQEGYDRFYISMVSVKSGVYATQYRCLPAGQ